MDAIGWFIATLHQMIGHDATQRMIGGPVYDKAACLICKYERYPTDENKRAVEQALTRPKEAEMP